MLSRSDSQPWIRVRAALLRCAAWCGEVAGVYLRWEKCLQRSEALKCSEAVAAGGSPGTQLGALQVALPQPCAWYLIAETALLMLSSVLVVG